MVSVNLRKSCIPGLRNASQLFLNLTFAGSATGAGSAAGILWRVATDCDKAKLEVAKAGAVAPAVALLQAAHREAACIPAATEVAVMTTSAACVSANLPHLEGLCMSTVTCTMPVCSLNMMMLLSLKFAALVSLQALPKDPHCLQNCRTVRGYTHTHAQTHARTHAHTHVPKQRPKQLQSSYCYS